MKKDNFIVKGIKKKGEGEEVLEKIVLITIGETENMIIIMGIVEGVLGVGVR